MACCNRLRSSGCSSSARISSGYWYHLAMPGLVLDRAGGSVTLDVPLHQKSRVPAPEFSSRGEDEMKVAERRQLARLSLRTPLRFRALGVASDQTEHFTEALNVSRGGVFFASSAPLQVGLPFKATLRMPREGTGIGAQECVSPAALVP